MQAANGTAFSTSVCYGLAHVVLSLRVRRVRLHGQHRVQLLRKACILLATECVHVYVSILECMVTQIDPFRVLE